ncbi:MAG: pyridoxamine 5'-phosphate oxidase family protein [Acidobacteria bacterium]|nr:pyridoxamine 5'-phosphate oxidase family protein [Acidobacteriota bacterium]MCB9397012.1 pyridoxamine 5'-phosphate oxidase family protein [Acidobacteriota bacterium]
MGQLSSHLSAANVAFIQHQQIFFVATAPESGHINLSPKGMDTLRVLDPQRVAWLNLTGSGNETAAHVLENGRITLMFCAFEGKPLILRLYGTARAIHRHDPEWNTFIGLFPPLPGARQIFLVEIEGIQSSCGMGVPLYQHVGDRDQLLEWADKKGAQGLSAYWQQKNTASLDGNPTGIFPTE